MMRKITLVCLVVFHVFCICAQPPAIQWQKCYGGTISDIAESIQQTNDGGYIVFGASGSSDGDVTNHHGSGLTDYWPVKISSSGNIQWQTCIGGSGGDEGKYVKQTSDGGYILIGDSDSNDGDFAGSYGSRDIWVVKTDNSGNVTWIKNYGGIGTENGFVIEEVNNNGYIIVGSSNYASYDVSNIHGSMDAWVIRIDGAGNLLWEKTYGGSGFDEAEGICKTSDGGYLITGGSNSNDGDVSGNHGNFDLWMVKIDSAGTIQWQKSVGGTADEYGVFVLQTSDKGYITVGATLSNNGDISGNHGNSDYLVVKFDSLGIIQWQKCFGGTGTEIARFVQQTNTGGYIITGNASSINGDVTGNHGQIDYWVVELDGLGTILWKKCLGGTSYDYGYSIRQTSDMGYIVAGRAESLDGDVTGNNGGTYHIDYWVVKLDPFVGIEESNAGKQIQLYPNPSEGKLTFSGLPDQSTIEIIDLLGQVHYRIQSANMTETVNINSKGIYTYFVIDKEGIIGRGKIVIN